MTTHLDDPNYRYSINTYADVDGTQNTFEVSFALGYISKTQVSVRVTGPDGITYTPTVTWNGANTVQLSPTPLAHSTVKIFRNTDISKAVLTYGDGDMISEANLDLSSKQLIMAMQETADAFGVVPNRTELAEALAHANSAITQAGAATAAASAASAAATSASTAATNAANAANAIVSGNTAALASKLSRAGDTATGPINITTSARRLETVWRNNYGSATQLASAQTTAANENGVYVGTFGMEMYPDGGSAFVVALSPAGSRTADRRKSALAVYPDNMYFLSNVVWHAGNDGHDSGLDADTVDGHHASEFMYNTQDVWLADRYGVPRLLFGSAGTTFIRGNDIEFRNASDQIVGRLAASGNLMVSGSITDGAGNKLSDRAATTVGVYSAADLAKSADFSTGSNANGYWEKRPNGIIEQWGTVSAFGAEGGPGEHVFPIDFTDAASVAVELTIVGQGNTGNDTWVQLAAGSVTTHKFTPYYQAGSGGNYGYGYHWRAIGR